MLAVASARRITANGRVYHQGECLVYHHGKAVYIIKDKGLA